MCYKKWYGSKPDYTAGAVGGPFTALGPEEPENPCPPALQASRRKGYPSSDSVRDYPGRYSNIVGQSANIEISEGMLLLVPVDPKGNRGSA